MTIKQVNTGAHGRKPRYFIENEGGGTVAHFDSLCTAALVLRYLNGAPMTEEDADMAWDAMQAFDMRNEGRRTGLLLQSTQRKTQPPFTLM